LTPMSAVPGPSSSGGSNQPPPAGGSPSSAARVEHVYVLSHAENAVLCYTLDLSTGDLVPTSQQSLGVNARPMISVSDPVRNLLYVYSSGPSSSSNPTISAFSQNPSDGTIAKRGETNVQISTFTLSRDGGTLYAGGAGVIFGFSVGDGGFQPLAGSPYALGAEHFYLSVESSNRYLVGGPTLGSGWELQTYRRSSDGSLTTAYRQSAGAALGSVKAHPALPLVLASENSTNTVASYRILENGSLTRISSVSGQGRPITIFFSPMENTFMFWMTECPYCPATRLAPTGY
jgi:6-phosphogluconolactonase (cycloisomerase 2 family)